MIKTIFSIALICVSTQALALSGTFKNNVYSTKNHLVTMRAPAFSTPVLVKDEENAKLHQVIFYDKKVDSRVEYEVFAFDLNEKKPNLHEDILRKTTLQSRGYLDNVKLSQCTYLYHPMKIYQCESTGNVLGYPVYQVSSAFVIKGVHFTVFALEMEQTKQSFNWRRYNSFIKSIQVHR